jgi:hypothetical protein
MRATAPLLGGELRPKRLPGGVGGLPLCTVINRGVRPERTDQSIDLVHGVLTMESSPALLPVRASRSATCARARCKRLRTVPAEMSSATAISSCERSAQAWRSNPRDERAGDRREPPRAQVSVRRRRGADRSRSSAGVRGSCPPHARRRADGAPLCAGACAEVGRDSVQPGQRGLAATIKTTSTAKGACERLSGELLREGFSYPPAQVAIDRLRVAIEHGLEELGPLE